MDKFGYKLWPFQDNLAIVLPAKPLNTSTESLAHAALDLIDHDFVQGGITATRVNFSAFGVWNAALVNPVLAAALRRVCPGGLSEAQISSVHLNANLYVGSRRHRMAPHGHHVGGAVKISDGGSHAPYQHELYLHEHTLHQWTRMGDGTLVLEVGGSRGDKVEVALPDGSVIIMNRRAAGELEYGPPPYDNPLQPSVHRQARHGLLAPPKVAEPGRSSVLMSLLVKVCVRARGGVG